jgi:hypothetical protein
MTTVKPKSKFLAYSEMAGMSGLALLRAKVLVASILALPLWTKPVRFGGGECYVDLVADQCRNGGGATLEWDMLDIDAQRMGHGLCRQVVD